MLGTDLQEVLTDTVFSHLCYYVTAVNLLLNYTSHLPAANKP